ncbi:MULTISPECIES: Holliday junction resolvase RuvX [unclassified Aureispira]|uniref:Holliday junction resolvase RuvX n=1 Tax=unclassified Aureispira TaxID=2649989 RepID=UPI0006966F12|nr:MULTISPECIES: Holliday junction resolvase RuvX [unclassified Aureispira]WMX17381.1 Holliday junction resolvase RuvX [Aureispira sp. CCB-E]
MARIMAIDYGIKRVGLATTDPMQIIASPLDTIATAKLMSFFESYLAIEEVECIVIGEPTHKDGTPTYLEGHIRGFIKRFSKAYPTIKIERQDENYTSKMAKDVIQKTVKKKKDRQDKELVDQISACIILQEYMGFY